MDAAEIAWRLRELAVSHADALLAPRRRRFTLTDCLQPGASSDKSLRPAFRVMGLADSASLLGAATDDALIERANRLCNNRIRLFHLDDVDLGRPIPWNTDVASGRSAGLRPSQRIDYRDFEAAGDAKFVWELNRHHHWVVLGRAYRVTGDIGYAEAVFDQVDSWLTECPYGLGMNWRSPLELAIRAINWVWALDLTSPAQPPRGLAERWITSLYLHLDAVRRHYSRGSSANNHLIGEAAGVYITAAAFPNFSRAAESRAEALGILEREILRQTFEDGANREQAFGYHVFVLQFFLLAALVAERVGDKFSSAFGDRLAGMLEFADQLVAGGATPQYGDGDDGYVLDVGRGGGGLAAWLSVGAAWFQSQGRELRLHSVDPAHEALQWVPLATGATSSRPRPRVGHSLRSTAFPDAGLYLLQSGELRPGADGEPAEDSRISVMVDIGSHGFTQLAAHGHADALSFTLRAFGCDVVIDPGTFDYFTYPAWRDAFRRTRAHSTIEIDDQDQSVLLGPFLWGARAHAQCLDWQPKPYGGAVTGEHDGYRRLADPMIHRRTIELDARQGLVRIHDRLTANREHRLRFTLPLGEQVRVRRANSRFELRFPDGLAALELDSRLDVQVITGCESTRTGWVSRGYHHRVPAPVLVGTMSFAGETDLLTTLRLERIAAAPDLAEARSTTAGAERAEVGA